VAPHRRGRCRGRRGHGSSPSQGRPGGSGRGWFLGRQPRLYRRRCQAARTVRQGAGLDGPDRAGEGGCDEVKGRWCRVSGFPHVFKG
jgi:hypothetical protein